MNLLKTTSSLGITLMLVPGAKPGFLGHRHMSARPEEMFSRPTLIATFVDSQHLSYVLHTVPQDSLPCVTLCLSTPVLDNNIGYITSRL